MTNGKKKAEKIIDLNVIKDSLLGGEGVSDIEEKRQKFEEKHTIKYYLNDEKRIELEEKIKKGLIITPSPEDFGLFILVQFFPLVLLGGAFFIPGIIFLSQSDYYWILIVMGGLFLLYSIIRMISSLSYKVKFTELEIKWRNWFWWNSIINEDISEINPINSNYLYFTKVGGVLRFGVEVIEIKSENKIYWLRAYPLRKILGDELVLLVKCWAQH